MLCVCTIPRQPCWCAQARDAYLLDKLKELVKEPSNQPDPALENWNVGSATEQLAKAMKTWGVVVAKLGNDVGNDCDAVDSKLDEWNTAVVRTVYSAVRPADRAQC